MNKQFYALMLAPLLALGSVAWTQTTAEAPLRKIVCTEGGRPPNLTVELEYVVRQSFYGTVKSMKTITKYSDGSTRTVPYPQADLFRIDERQAFAKAEKVFPDSMITQTETTALTFDAVGPAKAKFVYGRYRTNEGKQVIEERIGVLDCHAGAL